MSDTQEDGKRTERRCKHWLQSYVEWITPRTDAPDNFIFWSAVYAISAVLERRVKVSQKYFGIWECYPHLFLGFIGPPGMRKTTAMDRFAAQLLNQVPTIYKGPDMFTKEFLIKQIIEAPSCAVYLMIGELADVIQKNGPEIWDTFTSLYDAKRTLEEGTRMRGVQVGHDPCLNMFFATTPTWISANMNSAVIGGGWASRNILVYSDKLRERKLFFDDDIDQDEYAIMENDLVHDLNLMATLRGEFEFTRGARKNALDPKTAPYGADDGRAYLKSYYANMLPPSDDPKLLNYYARKIQMVIKVSMIHSIAMRDDLVLTEEDCRFGAQALHSTEEGLIKVFGGVGRNEFVLDMNVMIGYVLNNGKVSHAEMMRKFQSVATPYKINELLQGCLQMQVMRMEVDAFNETYYLPGKVLA